MLIFLAVVSLYAVSVAFAYGVFRAVEERATPLRHGPGACWNCSERDRAYYVLQRAVIWPLVIIAAHGKRFMRQRLESRDESKQPSQPSVSEDP